MTKKILFTALMAVSITAISAQDQDVQKMKNETKREIKKDEKQKEGWTKGGVFNLNLSQGASRNWAAGAEKSSFSINALVNTFAFYKKGKNAWDNTLNMQYGIVNATSIGTRKNDDRFDFLTRYGYQLKNPKWYASVLGNLRTQFTDGFDYSTTPSKTKNSGLFAPAYVLLSPGLLYKPNATFDFFISPVTSRWVIVNDKNSGLRPLYNIPLGKTANYELGAFASANLKKEISKNINYTSRLDLFSNYKKEPQNIDVFWTNVIGMKVNKYIGVTYSLDLIYDHDIKNVKTGGLMGTQLKSLLGVGFTATF